MKGFEDQRSLKALRTFDLTGIRDRLPAERVRRVAHDAIPDAVRRN